MQGVTALMVASLYGHEAVVQFLLRAGADMAAINDKVWIVSVDAQLDLVCDISSASVADLF